MNWYKLSQQMEFDFMDKDPYSSMRSDVSYPPPNGGDLSCNIEDEIDYLSSPAELFGYLQHCKIPYEIVDFENESVLVVDIGELSVITDYKTGPFSIETAESFVNNISWHDTAWKYLGEKDFSKEFWDDVSTGYTLYHGTNEDNIESIQENGIGARDKTRGISNRDTGSAVFTSPDSETASYYYEVVLEIDVAQMKADGYMPRVSLEGPIEEAEMLNAIAHKLGLEDYDAEIEQGLDPGTIIFYGSIPPKYLSLVP